MDETDFKLNKLFPENLDSVCDDLKWYLDSLNKPKNVLELHPKYNTNLNKLFEGLDLKTFVNSETYNYLVESNDNFNKYKPNDKLNTPREVKNKSDKDLLKMIQTHGKYFDDISTMCKDKRSQMEKDIIDTFLSHENELSEFSIDLNYCDSTLKMVEDSMTKQYQSLEVSSNNIKKLHEESKDISSGLQNRQKLVEKLQNFVKDVIITPSMVKSLCNDPINESYVLLVEEFGKKSENMKTVYKDKEYPAVIKKLELVLIRRIFDFLSLEISNLATPKVNIHLLQNTRFMSIYPLYKYLTNFPTHTTDLQKLYTYTMKRTYAHLFENYLNSLEVCFEKERCREYSCLLRIRSSVVAQKQNKTISYYDLNGRDLILNDFNSQPVLPTGLMPNSLKKELIVKSYFKLLVDTCTSESQFISTFFFNYDNNNNNNKEKENKNKSKNKENTEKETSSKDGEDVNDNENNNNNNTNNKEKENKNKSKNKENIDVKGDKNMLKEIFVEVFEVVSCNLKVYFRMSYDLVALVLIYCVLRFNRKFLLYREISFFESEMYELETLAYDRLNVVLRELVSLLVKTTRNPQISTILLWNPAPFVVNVSHIILVLLRLNDYTKKFNHYLVQFIETLVDVIDKSSEKFDPNKNALFLINNLAPLVDSVEKIPDKSVFLTDTFNLEERSKKMKEDLENSLNFYSNYLLTEFISDLINLTTGEEEEEVIDETTPKKTLTLATMALEYRNLCMEFIETHNEKILTIKNLISQSFIYSPTNALVNKHVFTMFHDVYKKFYDIIMDTFKDSPSEWLSNMPNPSEFKP